jgi:hypothetical protein
MINGREEQVETFELLYCCPRVPGGGSLEITRAQSSITLDPKWGELEADFPNLGMRTRSPPHRSILPSNSIKHETNPVHLVQR